MRTPLGVFWFISKNVFGSWPCTKRWSKTQSCARTTSFILKPMATWFLASVLFNACWHIHPKFNHAKKTHSMLFSIKSRTIKKLLFSGLCKCGFLSVVIDSVQATGHITQQLSFAADSSGAKIWMILRQQIVSHFREEHWHGVRQESLQWTLPEEAVWPC